MIRFLKDFLAKSSQYLNSWHSLIDSEKVSIKELFIIFFVFSLVGHYLEVVWAGIKYLISGSTWFPTVVDIIPLAAPYGLGAVALILVVVPILRARKMHIVSVFVISAFVAGIVEFLCAALLVLLYGRNYFWDYSDRFMNLFGFTCLGVCLLFGIVAIVFLYLIYPKLKVFFNYLSQKQISCIFWILFIAYIINLTLVCIREFL